MWNVRPWRSQKQADRDARTVRRRLMQIVEQGEPRDSVRACDILNKMQGTYSPAPLSAEMGVIDQLPAAQKVARLEEMLAEGHRHLEEFKRQAFEEAQPARVRSPNRKPRKSRKALPQTIDVPPDDDEIPLNDPTRSKT